jgi:hypothetical protein
LIAIANASSRKNLGHLILLGFGRASATEVPDRVALFQSDQVPRRTLLKVREVPVLALRV